MSERFEDDISSREGVDDFSDVKEGDVLTKVRIDGDKEEERREFTVTSVTDDIITGEFLADGMRTGTFNRHTGVCTLGEKYGRLERRK